MIEIKKELKALQALKSTQGMNFDQRIQQHLLLGSSWFQDSVVSLTRYWLALETMDPVHPQLEQTYQQLKGLASVNMPPNKSSAVLYALAEMNRPSVCSDIRQWLKTTPSEYSLRGALVAAAEKDNNELVRLLINAKTWSARPLAYLLPIMLLNKNWKMVDELLNNPVLRNNKDDVVFCMLSNSNCRPENKQIWSAMFQYILPHLSGDNIISSLNSYHQSNQWGTRVATEFLNELAAQAQKNTLTQIVSEHVLEHARAKRKI